MVGNPDSSEPSSAAGEAWGEAWGEAPGRGPAAPQASSGSADGASKPAPSVALTIAGLDPSNGAGITADLQTFAAHGVFGTCAVTALTVQSTIGVEGVEPVRPELLRRMLGYLWNDLPPQGIKLGMLGDASIVGVVADFLEGAFAGGGASGHIPCVFDPVLRSSSGAELTSADYETLRLLHERLLPQITWVTPNRAELEVLAEKRVDSAESAVAAAALLGNRHPHLHIVVTGGDLAQPEDVLRTPGGSLHRFAGEHIVTRSTHGTGCAFSAALLCRLMQGSSQVEAVQEAKRYVEEALRQAPGLGRGRGPLELLWPLRPQ